MTDKDGRDTYRDTNVRYLGYANEVGEAFRAWVPTKVVQLSYLISSCYVLADTIDKTRKVHKNPAADKSRACHVVVAGADTLIWQSFASIIIPGYTINRVCAFSFCALNAATKLPRNIKKLITTVIGLAIIPFIVKPIDKSVDCAMDNTFRKISFC